MNAREAVIEAIKDAPESMVQEVYDFVRFLKSQASSGSQASASGRTIPDFLARQKALFGDRILPDSQAIMDEMRADRI